MPVPSSLKKIVVSDHEGPTFREGPVPKPNDIDTGSAWVRWYPGKSDVSVGNLRAAAKALRPPFVLTSRFLERLADAAERSGDLIPF